VTATGPKDGVNSGVVELFPGRAPERRTPGARDDADSADLPDNGSLEAIAHIQKKLRAQISLVALARGANQPLPELRAALTELQQLTGSIIDDLSRVIRMLSDPQGSTDGERPRIDLFTRLTHLCSLFRASSGIGCVLAVLPKHVQVDEVTGDILFHAVRELLTNVRQHSHANRVEISSALGADGSITLTVKDDGIGLPPGGRRRSALETGAVGLSSIDLRLREIGAHLEIESDRGVCARLVLPAYIVVANGDSPSQS
jgi:signal transduction histidine kinase